jgi:hypothetical protein
MSRILNTLFDGVPGEVVVAVVEVGEDVDEVEGAGLIFCAVCGVITSLCCGGSCGGGDWR